MKEEMQNWYFTFGLSSKNRGKFVKLFGTCNDTRGKMIRNFGTEWSTQYCEYDWNNPVHARNGEKTIGQVWELEEYKEVLK